MIKNTIKKFIFISVIGISLFAGVKIANALTVSDGHYTNVYGNPVTKDCTGSDCQYTGQHCNLDDGTCQGGSDKWVFKATCAGEKTDCTNNLFGGQGTKSVTANITCGTTVQLDVFDENCEAGGGWTCGTDDENGDGKVDGADSNLLDYIVWYSGDCPQAPPPSPSPSPSPPVTCNADCSQDSTICQQAADGCNFCNPTSGQCEAPPPACGSACQTDADCSKDPSNTCTICDTSVGQCVVPPTQPSGPPPQTTVPPTQPSSPPASPTATPTPVFSENMCECDGFTSSTIIAGQKAKFTSYAKVEGDNVSKARAVGMNFWLVETGSGGANPISLAGPENVAAKIVEESPNKVRYQADWEVQIPANVDPNKEYRVFSDIDCKAKTQANAGATTQAVLAAEDENVGFFTRIINFFTGLFGAEEDNNQEKTTPSPTPTADDASVQQQLRLKNIKPGNVSLKSCSAMYFTFPE